MRAVLAGIALMLAMVSCEGSSPAFAESEPEFSPYDEAVYEIICAYPWPCEKAVRVAFCESTHNERAKNGVYRGWFQIGDLHYWHVSDPNELYDPEINTSVAYYIWEHRGWAPWPTCGRL